jgi:aerobic carbon-monoxide dehydrogenase large subunit
LGASRRLRLGAAEVACGDASCGRRLRAKIFAYPEQALVLVAARFIGRPVRWTSTRSEASVSDIQARDHRTRAELAIDGDGRFLAIRVRATVNLGAYLSQYAPLVATSVGAPVQAGAYRFQAIDVTVTGVFTNTVPLDAYRGAGRRAPRRPPS